MIDLGPIDDISPSLYEPDDLDLPAYAWEFARIAEAELAAAIIREHGKHTGMRIISEQYQRRVPE